MSDLDKLNEEFNNFMFKVNEVSNIVNKLASTNREMQKIGDAEAQAYLGKDGDDTAIKDIDEDEIELHTKTNRTVVNKSALLKETMNSETMSQQAFMDEISRDADKRYRDKLVRKERMETFKMQATKAFRRGEYEKALSLYNKAIDQIKDSCLLYKNRSLTFIKLKMYDKAVADLDWAVRLDENDLKVWLLFAKAYYLMGDMDKYENAIKEARERNPSKERFINEYIANELA